VADTKTADDDRDRALIFTQAMQVCCFFRYGIYISIFEYS
jgi:hypothetical protein